MGLIVKHNKNYQFEHIALPLYAYTYYLLTQCSTQLSRKVLISETPNNDLSDPFCVLFGVDGIDQEQLSAQLKQLLSDNPWTHALLEAEQIPKKQFNSQHKLWITLKVVAQSVFKPELALTVWQKQILNEQLKLQGWSNQSTFNQQLLALNLSNSI